MFKHRFHRIQWWEGLLLKVLQNGVSGRMYKWIRYFLHDRSSRVKVDGHLSDSVKMREGVPQGGVVSPTPFLVYINNTTVIPRHVSNTLHADDLAIWSSAKYTTSAAYRIQDAANKVHKWTHDPNLVTKKQKRSSEIRGQLTSSTEMEAIIPKKPPTYAWRCSSSPWRDYTYSKSTSNAGEE